MLVLKLQRHVEYPGGSMTFVACSMRRCGVLTDAGKRPLVVGAVLKSCPRCSCPDVRVVLEVFMVLLSRNRHLGGRK